MDSWTLAVIIVFIGAVVFTLTYLYITLDTVSKTKTEELCLKYCNDTNVLPVKGFGGWICDKESGYKKINIYDVCQQLNR